MSDYIEEYGGYLGDGSEFEHDHTFIISVTVPYRSIDGAEYMVDLYDCECGAGGMVKTPRSDFEKGHRSTKLDISKTVRRTHG